MDRIYIRARTINLLWRYEVLSANELDPVNSITDMENDIYWDLSEIDIESQQTKSFRMTGLGLVILPDRLAIHPNYEILDLGQNKLRSVPYFWFVHGSKLRILRLSGNNIRQIPWRSLSELDNLQILDLSDNPVDEGWLEKFRGFRRAFLPNLRELII